MITRGIAVGIYLTITTSKLLFLGTFMGHLPLNRWVLVFIQLLVGYKVGYSKDTILPPCQFTKVNLCQSKSSGGHKNTVFSTIDGFCAKKIRRGYSKQEQVFYEKMKNFCQTQQELGIDDFCQFIPRYGGLCESNKTLYIQMANLKDKINSKKVQAATSLDFKIGKDTTSMTALREVESPFLARWFWKGVHLMQDRLLSSSGLTAVRYAGSSIPMSDLDPHRSSLHFEYWHPKRILKQYLRNAPNDQIQNCFKLKLTRLHKAISHTWFERLHLISSSLLFVYDRNAINSDPLDCSLHMIDFANSSLDPAHKSINKKYSRGYHHGVKHIIKMINKIDARR